MQLKCNVKTNSRIQTTQMREMGCDFASSMAFAATRTSSVMRIIKLASGNKKFRLFNYSIDNYGKEIVYYFSFYIFISRPQAPMLSTTRIASLVAILAFSCSNVLICGYDFRQE